MRLHLQFLTAIGRVVLLGLVVGLVAAGRARAGTVVTVSGPSPFANCSIGGGPGAINYVNAGSCTSTLRIIRSARASGKISPFHD
jgi:hypothetical protein